MLVQLTLWLSLQFSRKFNDGEYLFPPRQHYLVRQRHRVKPPAHTPFSPCARKHLSPSCHPCHPPKQGASPVFIGVLTTWHPKTQKIVCVIITSSFSSSILAWKSYRQYYHFPLLSSCFASVLRPSEEGPGVVWTRECIAARSDPLSLPLLRGK